MNPILLQKQLRDNASDLQDFCKDLKEWGESMKRKEESIKTSDGEKTSSNSKVRKMHPTEKKITKKVKVTKQLPTKIGATDYAAWEKFDADAECEKLENDINDDSELTDECNEKQDEALIEKEKGNKFVHKQNWDEAINCYSKAIECYSFDPIFYANRALCYLKKGKFKEAEKDCTLSIKLDNTYVKAYQRRAAAKEALEKFEEAEYDMLRVLELEPKNKECRASLERLRRQLGKKEKPLEQRPISKFTASRNKTTPPDKEKSSPIIYPINDSQITVNKKNIDTSKGVSVWPEKSDIILVKAINKPPHLRSQKPLKRIEIQEINNSKAENYLIEKELPGEPEAVKKHVLEKKQSEKNIEQRLPEITELKKPNSKIEDKLNEKELPEAVKKHVLEKEEIEKNIEQPVTIISEFKKKQTETNLEKSENLTAIPRPGQQTVCLKSDDFKIIEKISESSTNKQPNISKEVKNTSNINISNGDNKMHLEQEKNNTNLAVPKTSVQFYLTWKNLKNEEDKYNYLKMIHPQNFSKIFLESLESNIFSNILEILVKHFVEKKDNVFDLLSSFTDVKRFGALVMFKTSSDVNNLWKLFDYIKETEQKSKEDVDILIKKYEL